MTMETLELIDNVWQQIEALEYRLGRVEAEITKTTYLTDILVWEVDALY